jgi:protein-arginine kinase activator protein McsA
MDFNEKYKREDLEKLIFEEKKSYREIGRIYGVSDTYIKKVANRLGIKLRKRKNFPKDFVPHNKNRGKTVLCRNCGTTFNKPSPKQIYCSFGCSVEDKNKKKYEDYINNQENYCNVGAGIKWLKKYFLVDQNNKCDICGIDNFWNGKPLIFVMDHIDGDASNNKRDNLRLICHNCDSQLDTYKSKNKNSARKERYLLNYKNI